MCVRAQTILGIDVDKIAEGRDRLAVIATQNMIIAELVNVDGLRLSSGSMLANAPLKGGWGRTSGAAFKVSEDRSSGPFGSPSVPPRADHPGRR
jgi:hypothetical protein